MLFGHGVNGVTGRGRVIEGRLRTGKLEVTPAAARSRHHVDDKLPRPGYLLNHNTHARFYNPPHCIQTPVARYRRFLQDGSSLLARCIAGRARSCRPVRKAQRHPGGYVSAFVTLLEAVSRSSHGWCCTHANSPQDGSSKRPPQKTRRSSFRLLSPRAMSKALSRRSWTCPPQAIPSTDSTSRTTMR